ncbi:restriction endonuclease subunit S [Coleofasciculus sp. FACHB-SPT9]|uniref:restriction endonuclease subunit S n=1 Tax=Cyanophyceae TaxID=3028117 RepID=UPI00168717D9|nr:restriction endonuclease subunit S [Coleofasciculus sp. FACHB-SPT9]MBD1890519.1 restriction endonuclease subunit S [Coleofasciculus sp. FACHB-SPT9]
MGIQGIQEKLPEGWHWVRCQDVIDVRDGTHDTPKYVRQGIPLITSKNLTRGFIDFSDVFFISEADHEHIKKRSKVDKGDIIMPMIGTIGNPVIVDTDKEFSIKNVALFKFKNSSVFSPFFYYLLQSPLIVNQLAADAQGVTQQFVSLGNLRDLQIPLPLLAEQKLIAAIAQKADRLRRTRRYALQLSDTYLQSVFLEMFGEPVTNSKGWDIEPLENKISFLTSGSRGWAQYYSTKGDRFLRIQNVGSNELLLDDLAYVQAPETAEGRRTLVKSGDILLSITADLGRTAVIPPNFPKAYINQHLALLRLKGINPIFLSAYLSSPGGKAQIDALDREGVKSGLNFDDIRSLKIIVPPFPLQEKFAQIVQKFERLRTQQREGDRQAEHLFQTLLHRAFRGELTPQDSNDEPASVLLEQIQAEQVKAEAEANAATQAMGNVAEYLGTKAKQQDTEPIQLKLPGME